jgi:hypothetical protein
MVAVREIDGLRKAPVTRAPALGADHRHRDHVAPHPSVADALPARVHQACDFLIAGVLRPTSWPIGVAKEPYSHGRITKEMRDDRNKRPPCPCMDR